MVRHGVPVLATGSRRADRNPLIYLRILNVLTISYFTRIRINISKGVLKNSFFVCDKLATDTIMFPKYAVFTN